MTMRMLIDARHREETRVAVVKGNRIEEFDFESAEHKQLKGNIYLAKVTRVEPSLQAAFIDYGGNRHGFLAFSEIHPDYYQIPKEDREALLREEAEHAAEEERLRAAEDDLEPIDGHHDDDGDDDRPVERGAGDEDRDDEDSDDEDSDDEDRDDDAPPSAPSTASGNGGDEKAAEALRQKRLNLRRRYKIQDVIHRRQVLLVQVVKEERGNKGAALTTYLSLAGRYCVLMPNTSHGGGISRKISNAGDRKRLKSIMADLQLPKSMGCIVRTAGLSRTKVEIRRDFDYLARLWDGVRDTTLGSAAPALIYQDSDLIKRAIRDIYNKDIDEVVVEGEEGFRHAKEFMRLLMPSHARRVKPYADAVSLFQRNHVEDQLAGMYNPVVQLKSGGYLVINPTEALVSIDINSGRSTREYGIEATAVGTNLEAAHEIARQLRLRDMAGLVVIDFIDMENNANVRKVEKAMKAALADDRARIQVGRISSFGLMEMSRQRLRTGVLEASTRQCPHCEGTGLVRTASSAGLSALRMLEEEAGRGRGSVLTLRASQEAAFYVLNRKRDELAEIEERYGVRIEVLSDGEVEGARMTVEAAGPPPAHTPRFEAPVYEDDADIIDSDEDEDEASEAEDEGDRSVRPRGEERASGDREESEGSGRKRRRRRGRRPGRATEGERAPEAQGSGDIDTAADDPRDGDEGDGEGVTVDTDAEAPSRRGRRGGRRRRGRGGDRAVGDVAQPETDAAALADPVDLGELPVPSDIVSDAVPEAATTTDDDAVEPAPKPRRTRKRPAATSAPEGDAASTSEAATEDEPAPKPRRSRRKADAPAIDAEPSLALTAPGEEASEANEAPEKPKRASRTRKPRTEVASTEQAAPGVDADAAAVAVDDDATEASADAPDEGPKQLAPRDDTDPGEAAPARRGWWQSTFGKRDNEA